MKIKLLLLFFVFSGILYSQDTLYVKSLPVKERSIQDNNFRGMIQPLRERLNVLSEAVKLLEEVPTPDPGPDPEPSDTMLVIFKQDFQNTTLGAYDVTEWKRDWNNPSWANHVNGYGDILNESGNRVCRVVFPAGTFKTAEHGIQWLTKFSQGYDELWCTYRMKYSSGFTGKAYDGKLHGLGGGAFLSGGSLPSGTDGFDARYMFKTGFANIRFYLYYWEMYNTSFLSPTNTQYNDASPISGKSYYGIGLPFSGTMPPANTWFTITQRIKLNTVGQRNGEAEGFINGQRKYLCTGINWRKTTNLKLDFLAISTFFGGSGEAPSSTVYMWFDDFIVYKKLN